MMRLIFLSILYIFLLAGLIALIERYWHPFYHKGRRFCLIIFNLAHVQARQELLEAIRIISSPHFKFMGADQQNQLHLPKYKFYTDLITQLMQLSRTYGTKLKAPLNSIRTGLIQDDRCERNLSQIVKGSMGQFLVLAVVIWLFIFMSSYLIGQKTGLHLIVFMMTLQCFGVLAFSFSFRFLRLKLFSCFDQLFSSLYPLLALLSTGVAIQKIQELSQTQEFFALQNPKLKVLQWRLQSMLERLKDSGTPILEDLTELIDEAWFIHEEVSNGFLKKMQILKFIVIIGFFVSTYFLYLFSFLSSFLEL